MIDAERVDFVSIPVRDKDRATTFYGETLGLERDPRATHDWPEFRLGNVTLAIVVPEAIGWEFAPTPPGAIAIRVPDVAAARAALESAGLEVGEMWDSSRCSGVGVTDSAGNRILLHRRYAPYPDGSLP